MLVIVADSCLVQVFRKGKRVPYREISVVAFDADDTLWVNEPVYQKIEQNVVELMSRYVAPEVAREKLFTINTDNLKLFGYGVKGFTLSMVETAVEISEGGISGAEIKQILDMGKEMLHNPVKLLDGIEDVLAQLQGHFKLMLVTKGDLVDQQSKIERSGLANYFKHIEILSEKDEDSYEQLLYKYHLPRNEFLMVGNSVKSDILPVVNIGGKAVHIPFHTTWIHEHVEESTLQGKYFTALEQAKDLLPLLLA
jgi:putative hydrolase of the HAD superfamily